MQPPSVLMWSRHRNLGARPTGKQRWSEKEGNELALSFAEPKLLLLPFFLVEINKIIAEASKGSKFYENERIKDEQLGRKIQATLQKVRLLDLLTLASAAFTESFLFVLRNISHYQKCTLTLRLHAFPTTERLPPPNSRHPSTRS